ncbi:hypothetical protein L1987_64696 [Smallanthus sonchifolius]|uniref:Uncharacterized protein n=1 Tax=Smallanthus sonchifolius TaxID=185202 RepID=A0ACB9BSK9_9ASTR|nr:hypothetical protein L1987_64696 [Smallanthus sonchifolius]
METDGKKRVKKKKKVHFAEDVMEPSGSGEEFRKRLRSKNVQKWRTSSSLCKDEGGKRKINMPANRIAFTLEFSETVTFNGLLIHES